VMRSMLLDATNPSSIYSCIQSARDSARSMRGVITDEMYQDLNDFWFKLRSFDNVRIQAGVSEFFDWIKIRSLQFRGVTFGTMLRDEGYHFIRLGTFMERADNTARILDVKYHTLLPSISDVGGAVDYYQWSALLRSVSAFDAYRKIYRDVITPMKVAELLILRDDMPRSLHTCMNEIYEILRVLCDASQRESERLAGELHAKLHYGRTQKIIEFGLHEYLLEFIEGIGRLTDEINKDFLVPVYIAQSQMATT
jgi:uncharacterized alpha-E superfamily protein